MSIDPKIHNEKVLTECFSVSDFFYFFFVEGCAGGNVTGSNFINVFVVHSNHRE